MKLGVVTLACAALAFSAPAATAQPVQSEPPKPALQLKPTPWQPKTIHRSQLRPMLKPAALAGEAADTTADVFVPAAQTNALSTQAMAAGAPVQLAATHANVPASTGGAANPLPAATVRDFLGRYLGAGVEVALSPSANEPPRRMSQVEIVGDADEFTVKWATMRIGANFKPETVKASQQEITFRPAAAPGQFVAVAPAPGQPAPEATAEIKDRTMVVIVSTPTPSGRSVQRYERTLTDRGMDVVFTRTDDGKLVRQVNLTLTRGSSSIWRSL